MFNLTQQRRAPYSDWLSQVERIASKRVGIRTYVSASEYLCQCYDCGLSPQEIVEELLDGSGF